MCYGMAMVFLAYLLYSLVFVAYPATGDSNTGWYRDVSVSRRVKRAKVEFPLSRFSVITWHNYFRRKPAASNMEYLHHSDVLADRALWWARKCLFGYAPQEQPDVGGDILRTTSSPQITDYGQNIYHISTIIDENDLLQMALDAWYEESRVYLLKNDTCLIQSCRHYKQLMWAKVRAVGCAAVRCDRLRGPNLSNELYLVCNYDRKQTDGQAYQVGYACSNCSKQEPVAKCDEGLCRRDGKGEVILPSENLVLDPVGRPTTQKGRLPTLPPGVKEGSIETSPQNKSEGSNSDVILHSPSLSRSTASTLVTRSTAGRSTGQTTPSPSIVSSSLSVSGRSLPPSNNAIPRTISPTSISGIRSMSRTVPSRTPSAGSTPKSPESRRTTAGAAQRTEAVTRSTHARPAARTSTIGLMLYDAGAKIHNELLGRRSHRDIGRSPPASPSVIADDNKPEAPSSSRVYNPPQSLPSRAPGSARLATRIPRFTTNQVQEGASRQ